jgi:hypothetical protein
MEDADYKDLLYRIAWMAALQFAKRALKNQAKPRFQADSQRPKDEWDVVIKRLHTEAYVSKEPFAFSLQNNPMKRYFYRKKLGLAVQAVEKWTAA